MTKVAIENIINAAFTVHQSQPTGTKYEHENSHLRYADLTSSEHACTQVNSTQYEDPRSFLL